MKKSVYFYYPRAVANELGSSRAYLRTNENQPSILPDAALLEFHFADFAGELCQHPHMAFWPNKCRWGSKSPMCLQHIELLGIRFPCAQFVHIFHDTRDAAQSFHKRWHQGPRRLAFGGSRLRGLAGRKV